MSSEATERPTNDPEATAIAAAGAAAGAQAAGTGIASSHSLSTNLSQNELSGSNTNANDSGASTVTNVRAYGAIPGVAAAQIVMHECHESRGGKSGFGIGTGGRVDINEECRCVETALEVMRPPISQPGLGVQMLKQCEAYEDLNYTIVTFPVADQTEHELEVCEESLERATDACGK